ncbi:uncharacterized protein LOC106868115 [Octopus bimaculoides]|uniref:uncharacterized protein LOC106868115 n=1 Tax=Octopus bimaculoides TaxID=37653 RepID=UPI00071CF0FD|nr:uncharacterized protein LOC106868115 [Octopus bimaculoides]|eukprot:XP_014768730.1 PREDICTED: uncharacterized protein LOC106868115 [Octopus bimaculoides]
MKLGSIKAKVGVEKNLADMQDWKPSEYWKRVTCIMVIHAGNQNYIMTAAQCSVNIIKVVRRDMYDRNGDYETLAFKKGHSRYSDCVRTLEFIPTSLKRVLNSIQMTM